jgi:hypothetical protein
MLHSTNEMRGNRPISSPIDNIYFRFWFSNGFDTAQRSNIKHCNVGIKTTLFAISVKFFIDFWVITYVKTPKISPAPHWYASKFSCKSPGKDLSNDE